MIWWIIIAAIVGGALAYAYRNHIRQSRHLTALFDPLAREFDGQVTPATALALPQLRFARNGRRYLVGAMASGGPRVSGTASRPGFNGPFSFVNLELSDDTGQQIRIQRSDRLDRGAGRLISSLTGKSRPRTGDEVFDNSFLIRTDNHAFARRVLDSDLRRKLLDSPQQRLEVSLHDDKISVHIDGYVKSAGALAGMIDIATMFARKCSSP